VGFPAPACTKLELKSVGQSKNIHKQPVPEIRCLMHEQGTIAAALCQAKVKLLPGKPQDALPFDEMKPIAKRRQRLKKMQFLCPFAAQDSVIHPPA